MKPRSKVRVRVHLDLVIFLRTKGYWNRSKKWWIEEKQKGNPIANMGLEYWLPDRKLISASPSAHEGETRLGANPMPAVWQTSPRFYLYSAKQ